MDKICKEYNCIHCNKKYASYKSYWNHNKNFHTMKYNIDASNNTSKTNVNVKNVKDLKEYKSLICDYCNKIFNTRAAKCIHKKTCNIKDNKLHTKTSKSLICDYCNKVFNTRAAKCIHKKTCKLKEIPNDTNKLIDIIIEKNKIIEKLSLKINHDDTIPQENDIIIPDNQLVINETTIMSRNKDNYINALQLCLAGKKEFAEWYQLTTTNELIDLLQSKNPELQIIETSDDIWIHPDLAIALAYWISPIVAANISEWIKTILSDKLDKELKLRDDRIKVLQDTFVKKQPRKNYPSNVIYLITSESNKKKRIYIIGKATKLKDRLSGYNKSEEHEVVYYKQCPNNEIMKTAETMILVKLKEHQEKANRDRFILPINKNINYFTDIIDNSIKFFN